MAALKDDPLETWDGESQDNQFICRDGMTIALKRYSKAWNSFLLERNSIQLISCQASSGAPLQLYMESVPSPKPCESILYRIFLCIGKRFLREISHGIFSIPSDIWAKTTLCCNRYWDSNFALYFAWRTLAWLTAWGCSHCIVIMSSYT